jgi:hypothetical protein
MENQNQLLQNEQVKSLAQSILELQQSKSEIAKYSSKGSAFSNEQMKKQQEDFENRRVKDNSKFSEAGKRYMDYLFPQKKQGGDALAETLQNIENGLKRPNRFVKQEMTFDKAKVIWWRIFSIELQKEGAKFVATDLELEIMQDLLKYFIGDDSSKYDLRKGICLVGKTGPGKTFLMDSFRIFCNKTNNSRAFKRKECIQIKNEIALTKGNYNQSPESVMQKYHRGHYFFDDLGAEPVPFHYFKDELMFMEEILTQRERHFHKGSCITHLTTNLLPESYTNEQGIFIEDEILVKYGNRIRSRMKKMYNFILWDGIDKRGL